jgi:hypothetical protein
MKLEKIDMPDHGALLYVVSSCDVRHHVMANPLALVDPVGRRIIARSLMRCRRAVRELSEKRC